MRRLKKRLPRNFRETIESGDLSAMLKVFDTHSVDARGLSQVPALSTYAIPAELIRWLVAQGAAIEQGDVYGETPLHHHSRSWNGHPDVLIELGANVEARDGSGQTPLFGARIHPANVRVLLKAGANVHAVNDDGQTSIEYWLERSDTGSVSELAQTVTLLVDAGAHVSHPVQEAISNLSIEYARIREHYNPESIAAADAAIDSLCRLAGIEPATPVVQHDGVSPIRVCGTDWTDQYEELFAQLVPAVGHAATVQGEAVRVATRILNEIEDSGAINWDSDFQKMVDNFPELLSNGEQLSEASRTRLSTLISTLRTGRAPDDEAHELVRMAVGWVVANPMPIPLPAMPYRR